MELSSIVWTVTWSVIVISWIMQIVNMLAMKKAWDQLGGELVSGEDLWFVRTAINTSMMLAVVYIAMSVLFFAFIIWAWLGGGLGLSGFSKPAFTFGVLTLPAGFIGKHFEGRIKRLDTSECPDEVRSVYARWLVEWNGARLRVSDW